jgi:ribonuclease VapC
VIVDTSALLAIALDEPEGEKFAAAILQAASARISAASYVEAGIRVDRLKDPVASRLLDDLVRELGLSIAAVTASEALTARSAYRDFGKGTGHAAQLNFGDCFAYALAKESGEPLLFKGDDFARTDLLIAIPDTSS